MDPPSQRSTPRSTSRGQARHDLQRTTSSSSLLAPRTTSPPSLPPATRILPSQPIREDSPQPVGLARPVPTDEGPDSPVNRSVTNPSQEGAVFSFPQSQQTTTELISNAQRMNEISPGFIYVMALPPSAVHWRTHPRPPYVTKLPHDAWRMCRALHWP